MDELTQAYNKAKYQLYKESMKQSMKKYRQKQLNKEVDSNHKCCTRCYGIKPLSDYGAYKGMIKVEGTNKLQEALIPYRSCITCRNRDRERRWGRNK